MFDDIGHRLTADRPDVILAAVVGILKRTKVP